MATELLRRDFDAKAQLDIAWREVADVATWPAWAPHIRRITLTPPGLIGPTSVGHLSFRPIGRSAFRISAYNERANWEWVGEGAVAHDSVRPPIRGGR